ncbi:MAG TPA: acyl-CoA thioesterase/bile acid-CoA:amino acid N-acyltransferase family protein [Acidisarcina sp.]
MRLRTIIAFCALWNLIHLGCAQTLSVTPSEVMADEPAIIRITGLLPAQHATIEGSLTDGGGQNWSSRAEFVADGQGTVDTSLEAPLKGSYHTVSAMGLVWSMMPQDKGVHLYEHPHDLSVQPVSFRLIVDGKQAASAELRQSFIAPGVSRVQVKGVLHGVLFVPPGAGPNPAVLVLGGSEGGAPLAKAAWLASHGFAAFALAYFHYDDLPGSLQNIPLEYFGQAIAWLSKRPEAAPGRLGIVGTSRGGELALQLAAIYPQLKAVVAYVPADVRYPACCGRNAGAAWTWQGEPLAFANDRFSDPATRLRAAIPVEDIKAPILIISGGEDAVWPSGTMAEAIESRLRRAHFPYNCQVLYYPHAGHRAGVPQIEPAWHNGLPHPSTGIVTLYGGTPEGDAQSSLDSIPKVLAFLHDNLSTATSAAPTPRP